ncbi:MAG: methionine synthase [Acidilobus sp.]
MSYRLPRKFPTTVIGSYPKLPEANELIKRRDRGEISEEEFHRLIKGPISEVVKDYIEAGVDIISDGEQSREDMVVYFAQRVQGYSEGEWVRIYDNMYFRKPVIVGPLARTSRLAVDDWLFTTSISGGRPVKFIITGPYTMMEWSFNTYYRDRRELIMALAKVIREEILDAVKAGAQYVQVDEPALSTRPWKEEAELAGEALSYVLSGVEAKRIVHICYGRLERILPYILDYPVDQFALEFKNSNFRLLPYLKEYGYNKELGYGVVDVHSMQVETVKEVKDAIEKLMKLDVLPPEKVFINPDCGLKPLPREVAKAKLVNMVRATSEARKEW